MALLSVEQRREYFAFLGLGEYNEANILKFQTKTFSRKRDRDGKYGKDTDTALRHFYNVKKYTKNFKPEEFKCECNGRHCTGYPDYMKPVELQHIQKIRDIYGKPITVTCGLRCKGYNAECKGSITNSLHLTGYAIDFVQAGVTDTLANRKKSIKTIKTLPNHHYTYGNGINSNGVKVNAPYMGNALHTDTNPGATAPTSNPKDGKLIVDGFGGPATITALQKFLKMDTVDGYISGQREALHKKYFPNITAVQFGKGGSKTVRLMQRWLGIDDDGIWGEGTSMALQRKLGVSADGKFGPSSVKALQKFLNKELYPDPTPTPDPEPPKPQFSSDTFIDVSDHQDVIDWAKVKASGIGGAIVRYADDDILDKKFTRNMQEVKKYGLHCGVYIYSRAKTKAEAERDAQRLYDAAHEYDPDMPYYIDLEQKGLEKYADTVAIAFLNKMAKLGVRGGVYANLNWWNNYLTKTAKDYSANAFWIAQWGASKIGYKDPSLFGLWQYSSSGSVPGVPSERVDMNKCLIKYWEKKPTPKPEPTPTPEPTPEPPKPAVEYPVLGKPVKMKIANAVVLGCEELAFPFGTPKSKYEYKHKKSTKVTKYDSDRPTVAYKYAFDQLFPQHWSWGSEKYGYGQRTGACCDDGVSVVIRYMNIEPKFSHALDTLMQGVKYDHFKTEKYTSKSQLKPGCVVAFNRKSSGGHVFMVYRDGKRCDAGLNNRYLVINNMPASYYNFKDTIKKGYVYTPKDEYIDVTRAYLCYGMVSDEVKKLQKCLGIEADGIWGNDTDKAVENFQKNNGLTVDKKFGAKSLAKLQEVVK